MSISLVKEIILKKYGNVITDLKAQKLLEKITIHENKSFESVLKSWENQLELPDWVKSEVTINETFFFRHPEQFLELKKKIINQEYVTALCVGVSSGEEAYSLAMIFEEANVKKFKITGLDLDPNMVAKAKLGRYQKHQVDRTPLEFRRVLEKYGDFKNGIEGESFCMNPFKHGEIEFFQANVLTFTPGKYDIILIRNVLIYFNDSDKDKIIKKLTSSLRDKGRLIFSPTEVVSVKAA